MKKTEKAFYENMQTVGYWSCNGGIEVKTIEYGIEDYAVIIASAWTGSRSIHRLMIHYETESPYIVLNGKRYHFNECIRNG